MNGDELDLHGIGAIAHQDLSVLDRAMEIHAPLCQLSQRAAFVLRNVDHGQIRATREGGAGFLPPPIGSSSTVRVDDDPGCATAGLSYQIGRAHV